MTVKDLCRLLAINKERVYFLETKGILRPRMRRCWPRGLPRHVYNAIDLLRARVAIDLYAEICRQKRHGYNPQYPSLEEIDAAVVAMWRAGNAPQTQA
jgi:hypothetical protein